MHIPDGFLSTPIWTTSWAIAAGGLTLAGRETSKRLKDKAIPLMGVMSAFVFAAQMINFPVAGGTSGHLLGGVLASVLLGPFPAAIVLSVVLTAQCLIFQDGGLTALGANVVNMCFIGTLSGYALYALISRIIKGRTGAMLGVIIASWCSVVLTSAACGLELAFSGTSPARIVVPAMVAVHMLIGAGEAAITWLIVAFVMKVRPDLIYRSEKSNENS